MKGGGVTATLPATGSIVLVTRLARLIYRSSTEELVGMNIKNLGVLAYLRDHPEVSQQTLVNELCIDTNTGVLVLNDLEDADFVERRRDPSDRRRHIVNITGEGLAALEAAERAQGSIEDEILGGLSREERGVFRRLLMQALESHAGDAGG